MKIAAVIAATFAASPSIVLPPNSLGEWVGETEHAHVEINPSGFYYYFGPGPHENAIDADCTFTSQIPGKFGYNVSCTKGIEGQMMFFETGAMEFDLVRFVRCTEDKESCD